MRLLPVVIIAGLVSACQPTTGEPVSASASASPAPPHFASAVCGQCHAIGATGISPNPEAPSFAAIVNHEGVTRDTLFTFLRDAHNYPEAMQFFLDDAMAQQLTEYMLTLEDPDFRPVD